MTESYEMPVYPDGCQFMRDSKQVIDSHPKGTPVSKKVNSEFGRLGIAEGPYPKAVRCIGALCGRRLIMHTSKAVCMIPPGQPELPTRVAGYEYKDECAQQSVPPEEPTTQTPAVAWQAPTV